MTIPRFGVIPTNGRECVEAAVTALLPQVNQLAVVEAGENRTSRQYPDAVTVLSFPTSELNISKWWNLGFDWARQQALQLGADQWDVAVINDDVVVPENWVCYIADDLRALGCVAGCSGGRSTTTVIHRHAGPVDLFTRMQGFAFITAGEYAVKADTRYRWYYSDDFIDWAFRQAGGMVMYPGCHVDHRLPNGQVTPDMQVMIAEDAATFHENWGMMPW